jgi:hypothetical protein
MIIIREAVFKVWVNGMLIILIAGRTRLVAGLFLNFTFWSDKYHFKPK